MPTLTTEYYLDAVDKLGEMRALRSKIEFNLDQASLRLQHYSESLDAIDKQIDMLERKIDSIQRAKTQKKTMAEKIYNMAKRLGL